MGDINTSYHGRTLYLEGKHINQGKKMGVKRLKERNFHEEETTRAKQSLKSLKPIRVLKIAQ